MSLAELKKALEINDKIDAIEGKEERQKVREIYSKLMQLRMNRMSEAIVSLTFTFLVGEYFLIGQELDATYVFRTLIFLFTIFHIFAYIFHLLYFRSRFFGIVQDIQASIDEDETLLWTLATIRRIDPTTEGWIAWVRRL